MTEPVGPSFTSRLPGVNSIRVVIVAAVVIVLALSAAITMAASPSPAAGGSSTPAKPGAAGTINHRGPLGFGRFGGFGPSAGGPGIGLGGLGGFGGLGGVGSLGGVTVSSIDGADLALKTADGWTRTITVANTTKITRAGATIGLSDLKTGDQITFRESKASDGSFTITAINVVLPRVFGQVTATTADSITIKQVGGTTTTIHVSGSTTFQVGGTAKPTIADVKVGMTVTAEGTQAGDGSFDALSVGAFQFRPFQPGHKSPGSNARPSGAPPSPASGT